MHLLKDENGNVIPHGDGPAHKHEHDHGCEEHACDGCSGGSDKCKNESVALLNYMVDHNEHHAAELDQMADNLANWVWIQLQNRSKKLYLISRKVISDYVWHSQR